MQKFNVGDRVISLPNNPDKGQSGWSIPYTKFLNGAVAIVTNGNRTTSGRDGLSLDIEGGAVGIPIADLKYIVLAPSEQVVDSRTSALQWIIDNPNAPAELIVSVAQHGLSGHV